MRKVGELEHAQKLLEPVGEPEVRGGDDDQGLKGNGRGASRQT